MSENTTTLNDRKRRLLALASVFLLAGLAGILGCRGSDAVCHDAEGWTRVTLSVDCPEGDSPQRADVEKLAEIVRRRLKAIGAEGSRVAITKEDLIAVEVPNRLVPATRSILTRTGRLEFRLVADLANNRSVLNDAHESHMAPAGWHWYGREMKDCEMRAPDAPSRIVGELLLVSDSLAEGEGMVCDSISHVSVSHDPNTGTAAVILGFNDSGAFWRLTKKHAKGDAILRGRRLAIITDDVRNENGELVRTGKLHSAPEIREPILGATEITGGFTKKTAEDLKVVLESGPLQWPLRLETEYPVE